MRVSLTGHRAGDLGQMVMLAKMWMIINKPSVVCSGMAMGWDTAGALAVCVAVLEVAERALLSSR